MRAREVDAPGGHAVKETDWTIAKVLQWTTQHFAERGIESPRLDAELLLADALGVDRVRLYTHYDQPLSESERAAYRERVKRRANREPVAYITGKKEFFSRSFRVGPAVLVPRPETEHLVELSLEWLEQQAIGKPRVLEVGVGSGALAITLALELAEATVVGTELSAEALEVARRNAEEHAVGDRLTLLQGDLVAPATSRAPFDLIIANLPYIDINEKHTLAPEVRDHEPPEALFAADAGMALLKRLLDEGPALLATPGFFALEIDPPQATTLADLARAAGQFTGVRLEKDLRGLPRDLVCERL